MANLGAHASLLAPHFSSPVASLATHAVLLAAFLWSGVCRLIRHYRKLWTQNKAGQAKNWTFFLIVHISGASFLAVANRKKSLKAAIPHFWVGRNNRFWWSAQQTEAQHLFNFEQLRIA
jgi:hypothetical protein